MSHFKKHSKKLESENIVDRQKIEDSIVNNTRTHGDEIHVLHNRKKKKALINKIKFGKFRGSILFNEYVKAKNEKKNYLQSQSSSEEALSYLDEGKTVAVATAAGSVADKKEIKVTEECLSSAVDVQCESLSQSVAKTYPQYSNLSNSSPTLSHLQSDFIQRNDVKKQTLSLEERRSLFQQKSIQSYFIHDLNSVFKSDNFEGILTAKRGETVQPQLDPIVKRTARHISVHKFDTFSSFEGTFDEDTGLGYLAGIEEDCSESFENILMTTNEMDEDHMIAQNKNNLSLTERKEYLYKVLVIGELGAGKTSIIKRYVHQFFSQHYRATIGVDFALKVLNWNPETIIRLQLWDIAGQERFGNMTRVYYKEAVGAFIVFDVTRNSTLDAVVKWKQDLDQKVQLPNGAPIPCVLLANKCDQQKEGLVKSFEKIDEYCKEKNFIGWFETSAKENINIEEAANFLVEKILQNDQIAKENNSEGQIDNEKFFLGTVQTNGKRSCTC